MAKELNLTVARGETLQSGKIFTVVEPLPLGISQYDLLQGIEESTYTLVSLANISYSGEVRDRANSVLRGTLVFSVSDDQMSFTLPASVTKDWPNEASTYKYDVFSTNSVDGVVVRVLYGNISVEPAITNEDI
jgi:hypothetical protein